MGAVLLRTVSGTLFIGISSAPTSALMRVLLPASTHVVPRMQFQQWHQGASEQPHQQKLAMPCAGFYCPD